MPRAQLDPRADVRHVGRGVPQDFAEAVRLVPPKAAEQGSCHWRSSP